MSTLGNVPTEELERQERAALAEYNRLAVELERRLLAACPIKKGEEWRVRKSGRIMLITAIDTQPYWPQIDKPMHIRLHGRLNIIDKRTTPTGDRFGRKIFTCRPDDLEAIT